MSEHAEHDDPESTEADDLSDELARKYDPERLLKMVSTRAGKGESLDALTRSRYEKKLGVDLGHVRIITGEFAEEFNKKKGSYAVTVGGTGMILMGGSPDRAMTSAAGRGLLAHELTHVAQAKKGLYKSSRVESMPFAEEGHEAEEEAEMVEGEEAAREMGYIDEFGAPATSEADEKADAERKAKQAAEHVKERVFEMIADTMKNQDMRAGPDPRRP